jgi:hypothetical protein
MPGKSWAEGQRELPRQQKLRNMKVLARLFGIAAVVVLGSALNSSAANFFEDFESYANGSSLHGQGGWAGWDMSAGATGYASTNYAYAGLQSVRIVAASDLTHNFSGFNSGQVVLSIWQYLPANYAGDSFLILLNRYAPGGPDAWSAQIHANAGTGLLTSDNGGGATLPFAKSKWMEYRFNIDLAANTVSEYYGGTLLSTHQWYDPTDANALAQVGAIDLYGNNAGDVYYDNLSVTLVPEPTALSLLAVGGLMLALRRKSA